MRLIVLGAFAAACVLLLAGCQGSVEGSGVMLSETREVGGFNRVALSAPASVEVVQGDREFLEIEGDDNIVPAIETIVRRGTLTIGLADVLEGTSLRPAQPLRLRVGVRELFGVDISGSGGVAADGLEVDRLGVAVSGSGELFIRGLKALETTTSLSGSGDVTLAGRALRQNVTISGSGTYDGRALETKDARVVVSGSGDALVHATGALRADVSGSGGVRYVGDPALETSVTGSGNVSRAVD